MGNIKQLLINNLKTTDKKYYDHLESILFYAANKNTDYIVKSSIYIEQFIKSAYKIPRDISYDLITLINEYISDNDLKHDLHEIRINANKIKHDEEYKENFNEHKCIEYFKIIDKFTDYITSGKLSKYYEVFSLEERYLVEKKSLENKIYTKNNNSINFEKISDPFYIDMGAKNNYFLSNYSTEKFCLYIRKSSRNISVKCPPLFFVVHNILIRKDIIRKSSYLSSIELNISDLTEIHKYEFLLLYSMKYDYFNFDSKNIIKVGKNKINYLKLAYENIMHYADTLNNMAIQKYNINYDVEFSSDNYDFWINNKEIDFGFTLEKPPEAKIEMWYSKKIKYQITEQNEEYYLGFLKEFFGHEKFREGQLEVIKDILENEISNIPVAIFPTGYGKSLIFQYCALLEPQKTIVIVPTEILACDQIYNLNENGLNIGQNISSLEKNINEQNGDLILYTIPEVFLNSKLNERLAIEDTNDNIYNIVLDECHNISLWGHQFEPTYFSLSKSIVNNFKNCNVTMFTATASSIVIDDIKHQFSDKKINVIQPVPLNRGHIDYEFVKIKKVDQIYDDLIKKFKDNYGKNNNWNLKEYASEKEYKTLIINNDTEILNELYQRLRSNEFIKPYVAIFDDKVCTYKSFRTGNKKILLSSDDFVVGINIPVLVNLICIGMPPSKEWFYQESGRVGRAYEKSNVVIYMQDKPSKIFDAIMNQTIGIDEVLEMKNEIKDLSIDISNINYFNNYFQNKEEQLKYFDFVIRGINENLYVSSGKNIGTVLLNFDVKKRDEYDFLFYMMVLMDYIKIWLLVTTNDYNSIRYQLYCRADIELNEMIDAVNKNVIVTTNNIKLRNKYIEVNNNSKDVHELMGNLMDWYFDTILSIKREKVANTYQLVTTKDINSIQIEKDLAKYFNTSIEEDLDENEVIENLGVQNSENLIDDSEEVILDEKEISDVIDKNESNSEKLLDILGKIYDQEEIDFEFYELYQILNSEEKYNLKYKLQKLLENGYIFGYELVLVLMELESDNSELSRFKKLAKNTDKDLLLLLLEKEINYITKKNYKKANKIIYKIYKPKTFKEWIKNLF